MRTTLDIDDVVLAQLKRRRQQEGKTLGQLVSEILARELARDAGGQVDVAWAADSLGRPLVDLEDKHALYAALDREP